MNVLPSSTVFPDPIFTFTSFLLLFLLLDDFLLCFLSFSFLITHSYHLLSFSSFPSPSLSFCLFCRLFPSFHQPILDFLSCLMSLFSLALHLFHLSSVF